MTQSEAFEYFLDEPELMEKAGLSDNSRRQFKFRLANEPEKIRQDTIKSWLIKAGFKETQVWDLP